MNLIFILHLTVINEINLQNQYLTAQKKGCSNHELGKITPSVMKVWSLES